MTRQQVARTTQSSLNETPLVSGILPRAAVRPIPETGVQPQEDTDNSIWRESRFHHDFSQVPVHSAATPLIQPKLTIGSVGDKYEQEADRVAHQVVSQINAPGNQTVQREEMPEKDDEEKLKSKLMVQRQSDSRSFSEDGIAATPELEASIQQARGSGQPLADNIRKPMEQAFGADFSGVKVHIDAQSERLNRSIQAKAFTTGQDIFFRQGAYVPGSRGGQELIAHELTHVVQQNGGQLQRSQAQRNTSTSLMRLPGEFLQRDENDEPNLEKASQSTFEYYARLLLPNEPRLVRPLTLLIRKFGLKRIRAELPEIWSVLGASHRPQTMALVLCENNLDVVSIRQWIPLIDVYSFAGHLVINGEIAKLKFLVSLSQVGIGDIVDSEFTLLWEISQQPTATGMDLPTQLRLVRLCGEEQQRRTMLLAICAVGVKDLTDQELVLFSKYLADLVNDHPGLRNLLQVILSPDVHAQQPEGLTQENLTLLNALRIKVHVSVTQELVNLILYCADVNPRRALLYKLLDEGIAATKLTIDQLNLLVPFSSVLIGSHDKLFTAYTIAIHAPSEINQIAQFEFHLDAYLEAQAYGKTQGEKHHKTGLQELEQWEALQQKQAREAKTEEAKKKLSKKQQDWVGKEKPMLEIAQQQWQQAQDKFSEKIQELAKDDLAKIASQRSEREKELTQEATIRSSTAMEEYRNYLASVSYHPQAIPALRVAEENFSLAPQIVNAIVAAPTITELFLSSGLTIIQINQCLGVPPTELSAILGKITVVEFKKFIASDNRLIMLRLLHTAGVAATELSALGAHLAQYDVYINDATARGHFSTLLGVYTLTEIDDLLKAAPPVGAVSSKMHFLDTLRPKAQTFNALLECLKLCQRAKWDATKILDVINPLSINQTATQLKDVIYAQLAILYNKDTHFPKWLTFLAILVEDHECTITCGAWSHLPGGTTDELVCSVTGKITASFVVHTHPHAEGASVSNPNASQLHLKPFRGNTSTPKVFKEGIPSSIWNVIKKHI